MAVSSLIDDLSDLSIEVSFDLLLRGAIRKRALVIAPRILAPFHLLLSILSPVISVIRLFLLFNSIIGLAVRCSREFSFDAQLLVAPWLLASLENIQILNQNTALA